MGEARVSTKETISVCALEDLVTGVFKASQTGEAQARSVARALVGAEIDGQSGHGFSRVASYRSQAIAGKIDGNVTPTLTRPRPGAIVVDAAFGFAFPAFDLATEAIVPVARETGIAAAAVVRSHHAGQLGRHVERLAEQGLVALLFANTPNAMAMTGGTRPVFGTNPIAFAAPQRGRPSVVVDMALSTVARGKILAASQKGTPIPEGWAYDQDGQPTTDAKAALAGTLAPVGGAKGAALAFMVEILAVAIGGQSFAFEASSFLDAEGGPPAVGQFMIAIDPTAFANHGVLLDRMAVLAERIENDGSARLPGSRRIALRDAAVREGLAIDGKILAELRRFAAQSPTPETEAFQLSPKA